jgi:hypothetical protein
MNKTNRYKPSVYCGVEALKKCGETLCKDLYLPTATSVIFDIPWGHALHQLVLVKRPVMILTASCSSYYLSDLLDLEPEGLEVVRGESFGCDQSL